MWRFFVFNIKTCFLGNKRGDDFPFQSIATLASTHSIGLICWIQLWNLLGWTWRIAPVRPGNWLMLDLLGSMRLWKQFNQSTMEHDKNLVFMLAILEPRKANYDFFRIHFAEVNWYKEPLNWSEFEVGSTSFQKYVHKNCICSTYDVYCIQALRMQNIYIYRYTHEMW